MSMYRSTTLKSSLYLDSPDKSTKKTRFDVDSPISASRTVISTQWKMEESNEFTPKTRIQHPTTSRFKQDQPSKYDRLLAELSASNQDWSKNHTRLTYSKSNHQSRAKDKLSEYDLTASRNRDKDYYKKDENTLTRTLDFKSTLQGVLASSKKTGGTPTFGENLQKKLYKSTKLTTSKSFVDLSCVTSKNSSNQSSQQQTPKASSPEKKMTMTMGRLGFDSLAMVNRERSKSPIDRKTKDKSSTRLGCLTSRDIKDLTRSVTRIQTTATTTCIPAPKKSLCLGDFLLGKTLGEGAFGQVTLGIHKMTGMVVAIKKIAKQKVKYMLQQFITQIKIQLYFNHPNIVSLYGFFSDSTHFYTVMEYLQGGSLFSLLKKKKTFTQEETAEQLKQVCLGLKQMHDNSVLHRDIKPQNVVITNGVSKLCDLGWAAILKDRRNTYCGTLDYVSPEIIEGQAYDDSVDIWCIGVLAFEMITGKTPFYNISRAQTMDRIKAVNYQYPCEVGSKARHFIDRILKRRPQERMDINELLSDPFLQ